LTIGLLGVVVPVKCDGTQIGISWMSWRIPWERIEDNLLKSLGVLGHPSRSMNQLEIFTKKEEYREGSMVKSKN